MFNADQTGFTYEMPSTRTLSHTGEKNTIVAVQSVNACTHSFTVMPTITYTGKCMEKLFICLKENSEEFGPIVQNNIDKIMQKVKNIDVFCTKSEKMTNTLVQKWMTCLTDNIETNAVSLPQNVLLLLDSYSAHWHKEFETS